MATSTTTSTTTPIQITIPPLYSVITYSYVGNNSFVGNDASSDEYTNNNKFAKSLSFGTTAPGQTSKSIIIYLSVPNAGAINNIKLALTNTGGITFQNNIFGIETKNYIDDNLKIYNYFQGINSDNDPTNVNNVGILNKDNITSQYAYLNVTLPINQTFFINGSIRYRWYFDYSGEDKIKNLQSTPITTTSTTSSTTPTSTTTTTTPSFIWQDENGVVHIISGGNEIVL